MKERQSSYFIPHPSALVPSSSRLFADDLAVDDDGADVRRVLEGVAVEEREVRVLACFERADAFVYPEQPRRANRHEAERLLRLKAVGRGERRLEEHDARLRNVALEARLEGHRDARAHERRGRFHT